MSLYEECSPDSTSQCYSPDSCDDSHVNSKKSPTIYKSKRLKASARERKRRHVLNGALESLRLKVSCFNENSHKLSKIEVLRLAIDYIAMLTCYLNATDANARNPGIGFYQQQQQQLMLQHQGLATNLEYMQKHVCLFLITHIYIIILYIF